MSDLPPLSVQAYRLGQLLWDYLRYPQALARCDCILAFGGHDPSVGVHAARLFHERWAPCVVVSGGTVHQSGRRGLIGGPEATALRQILLARGVPDRCIIVEPRAHNTSENFWFTAEVLADLRLDFKSFIVVQKPYTERRTYATGRKRWPDKQLVVGAQDVTYDEYLTSGVPVEKILSMMVGEVQRIVSYARIGYLVDMDVPGHVWTAQLALVRLGFDDRALDAMDVRTGAYHANR